MDSICYNTNRIKTSAFFGTITSTVGVGNIGGILGTNNSGGSVMSCVNFGTVSAVGGAVHSAVGNAHGISNGNIYDETAAVTVGDVLTPSEPKNGASSATREQLTTESFYHEVLYWETDNWAIENGKLPYLSWYGHH